MIMKVLNVLVLIGLLLTSCGSGSASSDQADESTTTNSSEITIKPMTPSPKYPGAGISSMSYQDGTFRFTLKGTEYQLGVQTADADQKMCANSAKGQHVHVIVDDQPYVAQYNYEFDHDIPDGEHYILAFLSRSYHESVKDIYAYSAIQATVEDKTIQNMQKVSGPMLFYSRPKGTYVGRDAENIMLDFYFINGVLGSDYSVQVDVGGQTFNVKTWQPYILNGLPYGENTVTLTLLDAEGKKVNAPFNPVSRTFTLLEDKAEGQVFRLCGIRPTT